MSYARFGDDSDVYVYQQDDGAFICCNCSISGGFPVRSRHPMELHHHMHEHEKRGDLVPPDVTVQAWADYGMRVGTE